MSFTILEDGRRSEVDATIDGDRVLLAADDLERALGWSLKPQGFCRGDACIPVPAGSPAIQGGKIDLQGFADLLGRPLACDAAAGAASIGESASDRASAMRGCIAPDFTLPDLSGHMHSLGDYRGRKALLIAWASW